MIAKLEWYRLGGEDSERQWGDILGVLVARPRSQSERSKRCRQEAPCTCLKPASDLGTKPRPSLISVVADGRSLRHEIRAPVFDAGADKDSNFSSSARLAINTPLRRQAGCQREGAKGVSRSFGLFTHESDAPSPPPWLPSPSRTGSDGRGWWLRSRPRWLRGSWRGRFRRSSRCSRCR